MDNHSSEGKKSPNKAILSFGFFVSFLYVLIGFMIFIKPNFLAGYSPAIRIGLALLLIAYGIFRGYRTYKMSVNKNEID